MSQDSALSKAESGHEQQSTAMKGGRDREMLRVIRGEELRVKRNRKDNKSGVKE